MSYLTPNFLANSVISEKESSAGYHASVETAAPMSVSNDNFMIPTSVFMSTNNSDRIEFFDRFAVGDAKMNMKLVSDQGRDIPAFYSVARGRRDGEIPLHIEWSGSERLGGVDQFSYDTKHEEICMNGQTFTKLSPLRE